MTVGRDTVQQDLPQLSVEQDLELHVRLDMILKRKKYQALLRAGQRAERISDEVPSHLFPAYRAYASPDAGRGLINALRAASVPGDD